jgi:hypothetical protein
MALKICYRICLACRNGGGGPLVESTTRSTVTTTRDSRLGHILYAKDTYTKQIRCLLIQSLLIHISLNYENGVSKYLQRVNSYAIGTLLLWP